MSNCHVTNGYEPGSLQTNLLMQALFNDALSTFKDIADKYTEVCARLNPAVLQTPSAKSSEVFQKPLSRLHLMMRKEKYVRSRLKKLYTQHNKKRNFMLSLQISKISFRRHLMRHA